MSVIYFIFQQTMLFTIPLMIVALGGMFSERAGVVNIALEGIMIMGAFTGILFLNLTGGSMSGQLQLILAVIISMATGAVFSLTHAYAAINMKADQTISGTALNMFAPAFAIFVARVIQGVQRDPVCQHLPHRIRACAWKDSPSRAPFVPEYIHHHLLRNRNPDLVCGGAVQNQVRPQAPGVRRTSLRPRTRRASMSIRCSI